MDLFDKFLRKKVKDEVVVSSTEDSTSPGTPISREFSSSDSTSPRTSENGGQIGNDEKKKKQRQIRIAILAIGLITTILLFDEPQPRDNTAINSASQESTVNSKKEGKESRRIGKKEKNLLAKPEIESNTRPENQEVLENNVITEVSGIPEQEQVKIDIPPAKAGKQEQPAQIQLPTDTEMKTDSTNLAANVDKEKIDEKSEGNGKAIASLEEESKDPGDVSSQEQSTSIEKDTTEDQGQDQPATNSETTNTKDEEEGTSTVINNKSEGLLDKLEQEMKADGSKESSNNLSELSNIKTIQERPLSLEESDYEYYGRGLVYNCQVEHWACVDQTIYQKCSKIELFSKTQNVNSECATISVFESDADCARAQTKKINDLVEAPNACQGKY